MIVYIESIFIQELALQQEQHETCDRIIQYCEERQIKLVFPSFCIAETLDTLGRRKQERTTFLRELERDLTQLKRSIDYQETIDAITNIKYVLSRSIENDLPRLENTIDRIARTAETIPFDIGLFTGSSLYRELFNKPQDRIIYHCVLKHLDQVPQETEKCFITRDKDFDDPDLKDNLEKMNCRLFFDFNDSLKYIESRIR